VKASWVEWCATAITLREFNIRLGLGATARRGYPGNPESHQNTRRLLDLVGDRTLLTGKYVFGRASALTTMLEHPSTLFRARKIITLEGDAPKVTVTVGEHIVASGAAADVEQRFPHAEHVDFGDGALDGALALIASYP